MSEVPLLLFLLHRRGGVVVDHAALALGRARQQHLLDDGRQRVGPRRADAVIATARERWLVYQPAGERGRVYRLPQA